MVQEGFLKVHELFVVCYRALIVLPKLKESVNNLHLGQPHLLAIDSCAHCPLFDLTLGHLQL